MNHLLLLDEVARVLHEVQHFGDAVRPAIEAVDIGLFLSAFDGPRWPVDTGIDELRATELRKLFLGFLVSETDQLTKPLGVDLLVEL